MQMEFELVFERFRKRKRSLAGVEVLGMSICSGQYFLCLIPKVWRISKYNIN